MKKLFGMCVFAFIAAMVFLPAVHADVVQNFDGGGTAYSTIFYISSGAYNFDNPITEATPAGYGVIDGAYRLANETPWAKNSLYFNNADNASTSIAAKFDFNFAEVPGVAPADGLAFSLAASSVNLAEAYKGTNGSDTPRTESYGVPGSLTLAFGVNGTAVARLYWNGTQISSVSNAALTNGNDYTANTTVTYGNNGTADGAYVTVTLYDQVTGNVTLVTNSFIAGMVPYESNVLFSTRAGSRSFYGDVDNINVAYNSEAPTSIGWIPGTTSGSLTTAANWEGGVAPTGGQTGQIYGGTNTIAGGDGNYIDNFNLLVTGGASTYGNGEFRVGSNATGSMTLENGTFYITSKTVIGSGGGSNGTLTVNGGHFKSTPNNHHVIGDSGTGTVIVNGGVYEVDHGTTTNLTTIGYQASGNGTFIINDGVAKLTNNLAVGRAGTGELQIHGGVVTLGGVLNAGTEGGGRGTVNMTGGSFSVGGAVNLGVNSNSVANMSLSGGTMTAGGTLTLGAGANSNATMNLSGGSLTVSGFQSNTGSNATATLNMSGDAYMRVNGQFLSQSTVQSGKFVFSITDDAVLDVGSNFFGGYNNDTSPLGGETYAAYLTFGGNSTTSASEFWVATTAKSHIVIKENATITGGGNSGMGWGGTSSGSVLDMSGGTLNMNNFNVGQTGTATMNFSGGTLNVSGTLSKNGDFNFTGGTLNANNISFDLVQDGGFISPGGDGSRGNTTITGSYISNGGGIVLDLFADGGKDNLIINGNWDITDNILLYINGYEDIETGDSFNVINVGGDFDIGDLDFISTYGSGWSVGYDAGWVSITATESNAVPEPATWVLLGLGMLAMGIYRKRRA